MKEKAIWYCTGCAERCAMKITDGYAPFEHRFTHPCILFTPNHCTEQGYKPNWRKAQPEEIKKPCRTKESNKNEVEKFKHEIEKLKIELEKNKRRYEPEMPF